MRNSDPDAAVYWLARMLEAARTRCTWPAGSPALPPRTWAWPTPRRCRSRVAAYQACHYIGMPECTVHLTEAVVYLSLAPKSNALYKAYEQAKKDALTQLSEPVPLHIRNAVTGLMAEVGYGKDYQYAHDAADKLTDMRCLPDSLLGTSTTSPPTRAWRKNTPSAWTRSSSGSGSTGADRPRRAAGRVASPRPACYNKTTFS